MKAKCISKDNYGKDKTVYSVQFLGPSMPSILFVDESTYNTLEESKTYEIGFQVVELCSTIEKEDISHRRPVIHTKRQSS